MKKEFEKYKAEQEERWNKLVNVIKKMEKLQTEIYKVIMKITK